MRKSFFQKWFFFGLICLTLTSCHFSLPAQEILSQGNLNLDSKDFSGQGIQLDGDWEFYWEEFCFPGRLNPKPESQNSCKNAKDFRVVPAQWSRSNFPLLGYATYFLSIQSAKKTENLGLQIGPVGSSYKLFINGELVYEEGIPGKEASLTKPKLGTRIQKISDGLEQIEITIHVANYHHSKAGILASIRLASYDTLVRDRKERIGLDILSFGAIFMVGIYQIILYLSRKREIAPLLFGIYCINASLRTIATNDRWILEVFPFIEFQWLHRFEYFASYVAAFLFAFYTMRFFPKEFSEKIFRFFALVYLISIGVVLFLPMQIYSYTLLANQYVLILEVIYVYYVLLLAMRKNRPSSILYFSGFFFYSLAISSGLLKVFGIVFIPFVGNLGLLVFILFQCIILSRQFSGAFKMSEKLADELQIKSASLEQTANELRLFTQNLESIVEERTADLQETKTELEFINEFSRLINSTNSLDLVFEQAVKNINRKVEADIYLLQLVNREKKELQYRSAHFPKEIPESLVNEYYSIKLPIDSGVGSYFVTIARKKTLYLKDLSRTADEDFSEFDRKLISELKLHSVLQIPLIVKNEVIGILHINKYGGLKALQKKEIKFIESLCEQLSLAVNNSALYEETEKERQKSEKLLLNILPEDVAVELKEKGFAEPTLFESVSVLFTDFKGFTQIAETLPADELVKELDQCFSYFDSLMDRYKLEKLKTIGDSYMAAGGIPRVNQTHAIDCVLVALEIQAMMRQMKELKNMVGKPYWELRLGIHSGPLIAGVIGEKKFAYDVWGDTVNTASRMESSGAPGRINISGTTYEFIKNFFECEYRGRVNAKNKGEIDMYYVNRLKKEYSADEEGRTPNAIFWGIYGNYFNEI